MSFRIRRGQSVNWRMTMLSGGLPTDMAALEWGVEESTFRTPPTIDPSPSEARLKWTPEQTRAMTPGRKRLRLFYTAPNGERKVTPDISITVE